MESLTVTRHRTWLSALRGGCALALLSMSWTGPASAGDPPTADASGGPSLERCLCEQDLGALRAIRERVSGAATVEEARALASDSTRQARIALDRARWVAIFDRGSIDAAHDRLQGYESRVAHAPTQAAVVAEFDRLLLQGRDSVQPQGDIGMNAAAVSCSYSNGEVIAIVLGLILGIIPGLILLVLLC